MKREVQYQTANQSTLVKLEAIGEQWRAVVGANEYQVNAKQIDGQRLLLEVDGQRLELFIASSGDKRYVWFAGQSWVLQQVDPKQRRNFAKGTAAQKEMTGILTATMPGLVREVLVKEGDAVARGAPLLLLEAMKMELRLTAPHTGQVSKVLCTPGQVVERGQVLVEISEIAE